MSITVIFDDWQSDWESKISECCGYYDAEKRCIVGGELAVGVEQEAVE